MPLVTASSFRQRAAGAADPLARRPTVVSRQALADHYFLLGWYVEIAPLALCSHGSLVAMTLDGTLHSRARSLQMEAFISSA